MNVVEDQGRSQLAQRTALSLDLQRTELSTASRHETSSASGTTDYAASLDHCEIIRAVIAMGHP
ncbi:MAG TPA: hypothetical protein VHH52_10045, partial [Pseudonocardiaceae bacterium]|nr:hypothetical protein [Pseudonocardiaceae bacterium]